MEILQTKNLSSNIKDDIYNKFLKIYEYTDKSVWNCMSNANYFFKKYTHTILEFEENTNIVKYALLIQYYKYNKKISILVHNDTKEGKRKLIKTLFNCLLEDRFYISASGRTKEILLSLRAPVVSDIQILVEIMNKDRIIKGYAKDDVLFGNPIIY